MVSVWVSVVGPPEVSRELSVRVDVVVVVACEPSPVLLWPTC